MVNIRRHLGPLRYLDLLDWCIALVVAAEQYSYMSGQGLARLGSRRKSVRPTQPTAFKYVKANSIRIINAIFHERVSGIKDALRPVKKC